MGVMGKVFLCITLGTALAGCTSILEELGLRKTMPKTADMDPGAEALEIPPEYQKRPLPPAKDAAREEEKNQATSPENPLAPSQKPS